MHTGRTRRSFLFSLIFGSTAYVVLPARAVEQAVASAIAENGASAGKLLAILKKSVAPPRSFGEIAPTPDQMIAYNRLVAQRLKMLIDQSAVEELKLRRDLTRRFTDIQKEKGQVELAKYINSDFQTIYEFLITTQAKRNLSSRSGIGGVLSAT